MTVIEALKMIKATLNTVSVSGETNLDRQLGAIKQLDKCIDFYTEPKQEEQGHADDYDTERDV